jgi:hypothetical protein
VRSVSRDSYASNCHRAPTLPSQNCVVALARYQNKMKIAGAAVLVTGAMRDTQATDAAHVNSEWKRYPFAVSTRALSAAAWAVRLISSGTCSFSKRYTTRKSLSRARWRKEPGAIGGCHARCQGFQAVAAGSRSQPSSRPTKRRMFRSARTTGEGMSRHELAVRKNSSRVTPERVRGRSMAHTS